MKNSAIAGFVAAMTVLATIGASPQAATTIEVQNSVNGRVSACDLELEADIRSTMEIVTNAHAWWDDLCKTQKAAADQTGLKTKAKIVDKP